MAICYHCHSEKPIGSPVCAECNNETGLLASILANLFVMVTAPALFFFFLYLIFKAVT